MKAILNLIVITIFFVNCATKIGNCQPTDSQHTPPISTQKIIDEISSFIDDDTAIVCYINLLAIKECYKLANIADGLSKVESFHERIQQHFITLGKVIDKKNTETFAKDFSILTKNNITHTYIILNMRDLKFGAYFVFPDVQKNSDKAKCIEEFFNTKKDDTINNQATNNNQKTWSVYEKNYMIVGGTNPVLSEIATIYMGDEQIILMLLIPQITNAICGYYNLSLPDRKEYINKRFKNFKPSSNKNFQHGIKEVKDCSFIKSVFLFPDSVVAWEFMHLKKMDAPLNQITFDFLKTTRDYVAFGIDTEQPKIKLTVQCKSPEDAIKFKKLIDETWRNIVNNYIIFFFSKNIQWRDKDDPKLMTPSEWADFIVSLLPQPEGNKLVTTIDKNYKNDITKNK